MSWSIEKVGTKAAVRAACDVELTKSAASYAGQGEGKDILVARDRILASIDGLKTYEGWDNGVKVVASGSASADAYLNMTISVVRTQICLDAPAAPPAPAAPETLPEPIEPPTPAEPTPTT